MIAFARATASALLLGLGLGTALPSLAQLPVKPQADHDALLRSATPDLAANKRLVYDFWREVFEAGHLDLAPKYMAESYLQHNPRVPTGRAAFVEFFSKFTTPKPIADKVAAPLVAIAADGDLVVLAFARELPDPTNPSATYTTTWFDMFRVENGRIAEHWDPALKVAAPADDRKAVADLDTQYQLAVKNNDAATMERILAEDFALVTGRGTTFTKADLLKETKNGTVYEHQEELSQTVRVFGDTAVVTALLWAKGAGADGKPFDYRLWFTDTYARTPKGWKYVLGQASLPLPSTP